MTSVHLYFEDENGDVLRLGSIENNEFRKIKTWYEADIRNAYQKKRQLFEQEEKEFLQLCEEKADEGKFVSFKDKWEEKNDNFEREYSLGLFNHTPFVE